MYFAISFLNQFQYQYLDRMKVWENKVLAENNKVLKYKACFLLLLLILIASKVYLEEFLTDYRASLLRKCKALMKKVVIIVLAKKLIIASMILLMKVLIIALAKKLMIASMILLMKVLVKMLMID